MNIAPFYSSKEGIFKAMTGIFPLMKPSPHPDPMLLYSPPLTFPLPYRSCCACPDPLPQKGSLIPPFYESVAQGLIRGAAS